MKCARVMDRQSIGQMLSAIAKKDSISLPDLAGTCELHPGTVKQRIRWLREVYGAPITSSMSGYHWRPAPHERKRAEALITVFCEPIQ